MQDAMQSRILVSSEQGLLSYGKSTHRRDCHGPPLQLGKCFPRWSLGPLVPRGVALLHAHGGDITPPPPPTSAHA